MKEMGKSLGKISIPSFRVYHSLFRARKKTARNASRTFENIPENSRCKNFLSKLEKNIRRALSPTKGEQKFDGHAG
jgi:hypothetical protein